MSELSKAYELVLADLASTITPEEIKWAIATRYMNIKEEN